MKQVLFIDRDGTLIEEYPPTYQIDAFEKLCFYPYVFTYLGKIARELEFELVMVSNQDGLGTEAFPEDFFWPVHNLVLSSLANEGIVFSEALIDRSFPEDHLQTRKPGTGMFINYMENPLYDLKNSFVIGDRITDVQLAKNLGCKAIWLKNNPQLGQAELADSPEMLEDYASLKTRYWKDIYYFLKGGRAGNYSTASNSL